MINRFMLNETSYFGRGSREALPGEIQKRGYEKVLVVTDNGLMETSVVQKVLDVLGKNQISYEVYHDVKPNPSVENVKNGLEKCKSSKADVILAIGGGSAIDTAKAIAIIMANPEHSDVLSLNGAVETKKKAMPLIAMPTTAGTAAEVTINYVISDEESKTKMVCVDPHDIPILSIIDSELMESMPKSLAAATGMDALTHAVEGYITKGAWQMSDMFHIKAIQMIFANLPKAVNEKEPTAVENMGLAQYIAGMGFSNVGLGIVHSLAHQLGAVYDTPHGLANAILLPHVMRFNGEVCYERFRRILNSLGIDARRMEKEEIIETFVNKIKSLSEAVGITQTLTECGVKEEDLPMLAEKAMKDICTGGNPREVTKEDMIAIYKSAM